jgi:hypothetical protein
MHYLDGRRKCLNSLTNCSSIGSEYNDPDAQLVVETWKFTRGNMSEITTEFTWPESLARDEHLLHLEGLSRIDAERILLS